MSSSNFNLRGIPLEVMNLLKQQAKKMHTSVNILILQMIERGLGFTRKKPGYHDLDHLAGTWSKEEAKTFQKNTSYFEKIDKDLWL
jgi:hypothetical protein